MGDTIRFVDSIVASPTVRLNLNDETTWATAEFKAPPPRLRRTLASNSLTPGGQVTSAVHEMRVLTLDLELITTNQDNNATELQKLVRELNRPTNILQYQPTGATSPVFFKTVRSDLTNIEDVVASRTFRKFTIDLLAEPYALGLNVTFTNTFGNDPAAASGSNPFNTAPAIQGDVPAPLNISFNEAEATRFISASAWPTNRTVSGPLFVQAESMTLGTDATVVADAAYSGGNYVSISFATVATLAVRLTGSLPNLPHPGLYKVLAGMKASSTSDRYQFQMEQEINTGVWAITGDAFTFNPGTTLRRWVDLGTHSFPAGQGMTVPPERIPPTSAQGNLMRLSVARTAGSGTLFLDQFMFVPVDAPGMIDASSMYCRVVGSNRNGTQVIDSDREIVYLHGSGSTSYGVQSIEVTGGFPWVHPDANNYIHWISSYAGNDGSVYTVFFNYYPRYLYVRPVGA